MHALSWTKEQCLAKDVIAIERQGWVGSCLFAPHDYMDKGLIDRLFARALNASFQAWRVVGGVLNDFVSVLNCITLGGWRTPRLANER